MLEQIAYRFSKVPEQRQRVYQIEDLERLSAGVLYSDGDGKNFFDNGRIETVLSKFINNDTLKIYIDPFNFGVTAGYQKEGESHEDYAKRMKETGGFSIAPPSAPSSGSGY